MNIADEIKRLEKRVLYTRMSSVLFLAVLIIGAYMEIPLQILTPIVIGLALAMVGVVGIPTLMKLKKLRSVVERDGENDEI